MYLHLSANKNALGLTRIGVRSTDAVTRQKQVEQGSGELWVDVAVFKFQSRAAAMDMKHKLAADRARNKTIRTSSSGQRQIVYRDQPTQLVQTINSIATSENIQLCRLL